MALADSQQLRMVERPRAAGKHPVTIGELRGGGIDFPAAVISELELHGYAIERVYEHGRLIGAPARYRSPRSTRLTPAPPMAPTFALASGQARGAGERS